MRKRSGLSPGCPGGLAQGRPARGAARPCNWPSPLLKAAGGFHSYYLLCHLRVTCYCSPLSTPLPNTPRVQELLPKQLYPSSHPHCICYDPSPHEPLLRLLEQICQLGGGGGWQFLQTPSSLQPQDFWEGLPVSPHLQQGTWHQQDSKGRHVRTGA